MGNRSKWPTYTKIIYINPTCILQELFYHPLMQIIKQYHGRWIIYNTELDKFIEINRINDSKGKSKVVPQFDQKMAIAYNCHSDPSVGQWACAGFIRGLLRLDTEGRQTTEGRPRKTTPYLGNSKQPRGVNNWLPQIGGEYFKIGYY